MPDTSTDLRQAEEDARLNAFEYLQNVMSGAPHTAEQVYAAKAILENTDKACERCAQAAAKVNGI